MAFQAEALSNRSLSDANAGNIVTNIELVLKSASGFALVCLALAGSVAAGLGEPLSLGVGIIVGGLGASAGVIFARRFALHVTG